MAWKLPWNRQETPSEPPQFSGSQSANPSPQWIAQQLSEVQAQLSQQSSALGLLKAEWAEVLDKLGRMISRQAARERRRLGRDLDELGEGVETAEDAPGDTNGGGAGVEVQPSVRQRLKAQLRARIQPHRR
jgi:hypothetical protein